MRAQGLPPLPSKLSSVERTALQVFLDRLDRMPRPLHPLRVWDEASRALRSAAHINVFYLASVDTVRRTFSIQYLRHANHLPEVGYVGVPFGDAGLCGRMVREPNRPYRMSEDDGALFRSGLPYYDEFDAQDVLAVGVANPDASFHGIAVVSSLEPNQFGGRFEEMLSWLMGVGCWAIETGSLVSSNYAELGQADQLNVAVTSLQAVRDAVAEALRDLAKNRPVDAVSKLRQMDALLMATQNRLSSVYSAESKAISSLTRRERQLMIQLGADGSLTNPQLAEAMETSVANVKKILSTLLTKTGAQNRQDLHRLAARWGLNTES